MASSANFGSMGAQMAQPSVRTPAMAERDQNQVWDNVRASNAKMARNLSSSEAMSVAGTSSYAKVFASAPVAKMVSAYGGAGERAVDPARTARQRRGWRGGRCQWTCSCGPMFLPAPSCFEVLAEADAQLCRGGDDFSKRRSGGGYSRGGSSYMNTLSGGREIVETEPECLSPHRYHRRRISGLRIDGPASQDRLQSSHHEDQAVTRSHGVSACNQRIMRPVSSMPRSPICRRSDLPTGRGSCTSRVDTEIICVCIRQPQAARSFANQSKHSEEKRAKARWGARRAAGLRSFVSSPSR